MNSVMAIVSDVHRSTCAKGLLQLQAPPLILRRVSLPIRNANRRWEKVGICDLDLSQSLAGCETIDKPRVGGGRVLEEARHLIWRKVVSCDCVRIIERWIT